MVVDPSHMIIEAVFRCKWCPGTTSEDIHSRLLAHHGLNANQLPLLSGHWMDEAREAMGIG